MAEINHEEAAKYVPPHVRQSEKTETSKNQADPSINKEAESSVHEAEPKMRNSEYKTLPPPPFPNRLKNAKLDKQFNKFLDVFKQLHINIPLIDALQSMPSYAKFIKEILSNKRKWEHLDMVALTEECSARLQNKIPPKLKDPGSFDIPCHIGNFNFMALCDLGASINLMPFSVYRKLGVGEVKPTSVSLQMADRSLKRPRGILEDVLVKVNKFIFPADFIILDMEEDEHLPIILGRPFLATGKALIDVQKGDLTLRVLDEEVSFNVFNTLKFPSMNDSSSCYMVDEIECMINECIRESELNPVVKSLSEETHENRIEPNLAVGYMRVFEELGEREPSKEPSQIKPPTLELKPLPSHLKYAYLGEKETLPVVISSTLSEKQESELLGVLRKHSSALGWTIADIKGISPSICMHKILMEEDHKPSIESQRRLNPNLKEVVRKEVLKLLDAGIIYPISVVIG